MLRRKPYSNASRSRHSRNRLEKQSLQRLLHRPLRWPTCSMVRPWTSTSCTSAEPSAPKLAFGPVPPQHGLALALGDRLAALPAIDIFPGWIDCGGVRARLFPNRSGTHARPDTGPRRSGGGNAGERADRCGSNAGQRSSRPAPTPGNFRPRRLRLRHCVIDRETFGHAPWRDCTAFVVWLSASDGLLENSGIRLRPAAPFGAGLFD
jgi:hypothetical protein